MDDLNIPPLDGFRLESLPQETCVRLLQLYSRMLVALDGFWYLSCADKTGTSSAVDSDIQVWRSLSRYVTHDVARALEIPGRRAEDYALVLGARPNHYLFAEKWEIVGRGRALQTIRRCPTLLALEKEGQGRDSTHCREACAPIRAAHAKYFNPALEVVCHKMPPRNGEDDLACQWEYVEKASPAQSR